jgi:hypothetical protein
MITPSYGLTATERVLPRLALDFTTGVADARVATTRSANTATRFNASGLIEIVNANLPRFDFNPSSLVCRGQLIEETRTNLFLNSLIDGTNLATQSVTLSAVAYTVSFYGSGSITISGGHSATVTGVGDFPNRKIYTFTPTAGSSTFTVTGDVKFANLEAGTFATSYIPTTTTSLTRNADVVSMTGANFSSWYNASEGSLVVEASTFKPTTLAGSAVVAEVNDGTLANRNVIQYQSNFAEARTVAGGVIVAQMLQAYTAGATDRLAYGFKTNSFAFGRNGTLVGTDAAGTNPTVNQLMIGSFSNNTAPLNGYVRTVRFYPSRLTNAEIQAFSKG